MKIFGGMTLESLLLQKRLSLLIKRCTLIRSQSRNGLKMRSYGLFYINWEYGAEAEQEALKRLGYAELEISEATRAFVIQAARAARLPRHQERELTTKLDHTRLLLAQLSRCNDPEIDPYL